MVTKGEDYLSAEDLCSRGRCEYVASLKGVVKDLYPAS